MLQKEITKLKELNYDEGVKNLLLKDIGSTKRGKIALRLHNAFIRGGEMQVTAAQDSIYNSSKINYSESRKIYNTYIDFISWTEKFNKSIEATSG